MDKDQAKIAVLDVETTGLDPKSDRIIQLACLVLKPDCSPLKLFDSYVNPGKDAQKIFQKGTYKFHNISPEMLKDERSFEQIAEEILDLFKDIDLVVGHNIQFDWDMMRYEFARLDMTLNSDNDDTDESWNAAKIDANLDVKKPGNWLNRFLDLKFQLLDTFRMAVLAYPNEPSYSLTSLTSYFNLRIRKSQTVSYRWMCQDDFEEKELKVLQKNDKLKAHNAITDVFVTTELFKNCLKKLNIKCASVILSDFPEFLISRLLLTEAEKLMEGSPTNQELIKLTEIAPNHMNTRLPERGRKLKDMQEDKIQLVLDRMLNGSLYSTEREVLIYRAFKCLAGNKTNSAEDLMKNADMFYGLRFEAENTKKDSRSPLKDKMERFRLSESKAKESQVSGCMSVEGEGSSALKIPKMSRDVLQDSEIHFSSDIYISSGDVEDLGNAKIDVCSETPNKQMTDDSEELVSPIFDKVVPAFQESLSESMLTSQHLPNTSVVSENESQVFPVVSTKAKETNGEKSKVKRNLMMSPDY